MFQQWANSSIPINENFVDVAIPLKWPNGWIHQMATISNTYFQGMAPLVWLDQQFDRSEQQVRITTITKLATARQWFSIIMVGFSR